MMFHLAIMQVNFVRKTQCLSLESLHEILCILFKLCWKRVKCLVQSITSTGRKSTKHGGTTLPRFAVDKRRPRHWQGQSWRRVEVDSGVGHLSHSRHEIQSWTTQLGHQVSNAQVLQMRLPACTSPGVGSTFCETAKLNSVSESQISKQNLRTSTYGVWDPCQRLQPTLSHALES